MRIMLSFAAYEYVSTQSACLDSKVSPPLCPTTCVVSAQMTQPRARTPSAKAVLSFGDCGSDAAHVKVAQERTSWQPNAACWRNQETYVHLRALPIEPSHEEHAGNRPDQVVLDP